ncbi:MAG: hypothetical protein HYZ13_03590 [Acidobacteria bacterium]|nr:hypothetical protein [Acidobacteriota bacterium]
MSGFIEYLYRARIFAEGGRDAAAFNDLPPTAIDIKGRTVYPDGRVVLFNSRKDFAEKVVDGWGGKARATHLVAPGVTADCVVELSWAEPANGPVEGLPRRMNNGWYGAWTLANAYPTQAFTVEIGKYFPLDYSVIPGSGAAPVVTEGKGMKQFAFKNVQALEVPPYGLRASLRAPKLIMYWQPKNLSISTRSGAESYWQDAAKNLFRNDYVGAQIDRGKAFKALAKELTTGLPAIPTQAAAELLSRLDARIVNLGHATNAERAALPKDFWETFNVVNLSRAAEQGCTNAIGMRLLFYCLLEEMGIKPLVAKVVDREQALFEWGQLNPWQFGNDLIGVRNPDGATVWFEPTRRFVTPGVVHPDYTGVPALILDSASWKATRGVVGVLDARFNRRKYTYAMELDESSDTYDLSAEFTGFPENVERSRYLALDPKEQSKTLKEHYERSMKNLQVASAEVFNSASAQMGLSWTLKGALEREGGRSRVVEPFPGMPWPLWIPDRLEETRALPIVLPYPMVQEAVSTFKIPAGYRIPTLQGVSHENGFGRVTWTPTVDAANRTVKVVFQTEVGAYSAPPPEWQAFRTFLGWVESACRMQILLSRGE